MFSYTTCSGELAACLFFFFFFFLPTIKLILSTRSDKGDEEATGREEKQTAGRELVTVRAHPCSLIHIDCLLRLRANARLPFLLDFRCHPQIQTEAGVGSIGRGG